SRWAALRRSTSSARGRIGLSTGTIARSTATSRPTAPSSPRGGVDLAKLPDAFEGDMRDVRITAAIGVDPGLTYAFTDASVAAIDLHVLLINLGDEERLRAADVSAAGSDLVGRLPHAEYVTAAPANHFTF